MKPLVYFHDKLQPEYTPLHWFWNHRIANYSFNLLIGHPGVGKSILAAELASHVSAGKHWPDAPADCPTRSTEYPPHRGGVLYVSAEDALEPVLVPRIEAAAANLDNVAYLTHIATDDVDHHRVRFSLRNHLDMLAQAIRNITSPRLVILDTLTSLLAPPVRDPCDPRPLPQSQSATAIAARLQELAHRYGVTIIALAHVARRAESSALLRAHAALPFVGAARSAMWVTTDLRDPRIRHLVWLKAVEADSPPPLTFRIDSGPRIRWLDPRCAPPSAQLDQTDDRANLLREAIDWLESELASGPLPAREILARARAHGFTPTVLYRAKRAAGVLSIQPHVGTAHQWSLTTASYNKAEISEKRPQSENNVTQ